MRVLDARLCAVFAGRMTRALDRVLREAASPGNFNWTPGDSELEQKFKSNLESRCGHKSHMVSFLPHSALAPSLLADPGSLAPTIVTY
eukprot:1144703-Pelagomonas_calceolata.AAC.1